jgi:hypothetical protein
MSRAALVNFGLEVSIRCAWYEWPLSGNYPNFAKPAPCALLTLVGGAAWGRSIYPLEWPL